MMKNEAVQASQIEDRSEGEEEIYTYLHPDARLGMKHAIRSNRPGFPY